MKSILRKKCIVLLLIVGVVAGLFQNYKVYAAAYTPASITIDPQVVGKKFNARETITIPFYIRKYSRSEYGLYYCEIRNAEGDKVASSYDVLSDLGVGNTRLTLFWDYSNEPHEIGKYTIRYYTDNNIGGTSYFYIASDSGKCGSNIKWSIDENGKMTISGSGNMKNYEYSSDYPWAAQRQAVTSIVIKKGVKSIPKRAFSDFINLKEVSLPTSLKTIGNYSFDGCSSLECIAIPKGIKCISAGVFNDCTNLTKVTIPITVTKIDYGAFDDTNIERIIYYGSKTMMKELDISSSSGLSSGVKYTYKIKPLKKFNFTFAKSIFPESVTLKWKKQSKVDGYEIEYSDDGFKSVEKRIVLKKKKITNKNVNNLYSFYKYSFRIRAYKKINGVKNYSEWSKVKKVKPMEEPW